MRFPAALLLASLLCAHAGPVHAAPERVELETPRTVEGLQLEDVDGDGLTEILVIEGRTLRVFRGRKGALPAARPAWTGDIPEGVSFIDVAPPWKGHPPGLLIIGTQGAQRMPVLGEGKPETMSFGSRIAWRDSKRVVFADLWRKDGLLLPQADGVILRTPAGDAISAKLQPVHTVKAPGPFLEDSSEVVTALPSVVIGRDAVPRGRTGDPRGVWTIDGTDLVAVSTGKARVRWDLSFLGADEQGKDVEQTLVDLDEDGYPDLIHRIYTNRDSRYGFFRTRLPPKNAKRGDPGPSHKPAVSDIYLSGFQLPMDLIDLDGDGLKDLVLTSIQVNAANTLRALSSGVVSAETRAFLNRSKQPGHEYFRSEADALVKSDILVKVRFNYAGTVEVERSFTILLDGDFDGDGRKDLAIRTGPETLTVRRGAAAGVWEAKGVELPIPPMGDAADVDGYTADLDGDGKDEIVLLYRGPPGGNDRLWVLRTH